MQWRTSETLLRTCWGFGIFQWWRFGQSITWQFESDPSSTFESIWRGNDDKTFWTQKGNDLYWFLSSFGQRVLKTLELCLLVIFNIIFLVLCSYNVLKDEIQTLSVFQTPDHLAFRDTNLGIRVPPGCQIHHENNTNVYMENYENEEHYVKRRLKQLSLNINVDLGLFQMSPRAGFNRHLDQNAKTVKKQMTHLFEQRYFRYINL